MNKNKKLWLIYGMLFFATATWGSAFLAGKVAVKDFEPATVAFLRFFGAAILLFPLMWLMEKKSKEAHSQRLWIICRSWFNRHCNI
jgi:drug/metabolite transporter (DMT)-like permease